MINYISKVTIYVQNQDEAMAFWTEKMGFDCDIKPMGPGFKWVEVKPQTDSLTSFVIYEKALMKSQNPQTNVEHPSIILSTQDIQVTYEEMKEKGITSSKKIEVLDSESASAGQLEQALYIRDLCEQGLNFEEVVEKLRKFRDEMHTYFVLESLDTLRKNGRLSGLQAFFATALNIKPVMGADHGVIIKLDQARGINKGLQRMCDIAIKEAGDTTGKRAVVCHVNNPERGEYVKQELAKRASFKEIVVTNAAGVATVYANDGGIVLAIG